MTPVNTSEPPILSRSPVMDGTSIFILRAVTSFEAFFGISLNLLLAYLVRYRTPKEHQNFSFLILCSALMMAFFCFLGWTTVNQMVGVTVEGQAAKNVVYVIYGLSLLLGPYLAFFLDQFTFPLIMMQTVMNPLIMSYRLFIFHSGQISRIRLFLIVLLSSTPWFYAACFKVTQYVPEDQVYEEEPSFRDLKGLVVFGIILYSHGWVDVIFTVSHYLPFGCFALTVLFSGCLLFSIAKFGSHMSAATKKMHKEFLLMLSIQSCISLLSAISVIFINWSLRNIKHPLVNSLAYIILVLGPIFDAIVAIVCIPHYRKITKGWFCFTKRSVSVISVQPVVLS